MAQPECAERLSAELLAACQISDVVTSEPEDTIPTPPVLSPTTSTSSGSSGSSGRLLTPSQTRTNSLATLAEAQAGKTSSDCATDLGMGFDLDELQTQVPPNPLWPEAKSPRPTCTSQARSASLPDDASPSIPPRVLKSTPTPELGRHEYPDSAFEMPVPTLGPATHRRTSIASGPPSRVYHDHGRVPVDNEHKRRTIPAAPSTRSPHLSSVPPSPHCSSPHPSNAFTPATHCPHQPPSRLSTAPLSFSQTPIPPPIPPSLLARHPTWATNQPPKELLDKLISTINSPAPKPASSPTSPVLSRDSATPPDSTAGDRPDVSTARKSRSVSVDARKVSKGRQRPRPKGSL